MAFGLRKISSSNFAAKLASLALLTFAPLASAQPESIQEIQNLVRRWANLERQSTALATSWLRQEPLLRQRLELLEREKSQLETLIEDSEQDTSAVEQRRSELLALQNTMESDQASLAQSLQSAMATLTNLHHQLPPPLHASWESSLTALNERIAGDPEQEVNFRLESVLAMLGQLEDFQVRISVHASTVNRSGREILVEQIYLGASHGWYVSADDQVAGYGQITPAGWQWLDNVEVDPATVRSALIMLETNNDIEMITLPLRLRPLPIPLIDGNSVNAVPVAAGAADSAVVRRFFENPITLRSDR